jgi:hypothetical protein
MAITFELPAAIEQQLRGEWDDFDAVAKESALAELYRQGKLTHHQLATSLELDRIAVDALLKRHQVTEDLISSEGLASQLAALNDHISK